MTVLSTLTVPFNLNAQSCKTEVKLDYKTVNYITTAHLSVTNKKVKVVPVTSGQPKRLFHEGLAAVQESVNPQIRKWGYINKSGKFVIQPQFVMAYDFHDGIARVQLDPMSYQFIDKTGKFVFETKYGMASDFNEGLAAVMVNGRWGFIDREGKMVIEPKFESSGDFHDGFAVVNYQRRRVFIDKTGNVILDNGYFMANNFYEGVASVKKGPGFIFIDKNGNVIFGNDVVLSGAWDFKDGRGRYTIGMITETGFIDNTGNVVFKLDSSARKSGDFSDGLLQVTSLVDNQFKVGYLNTEGKYVINPTFQQANDFHEGMAAVAQAGMWGIIDKNGNIIVKLELTSIDDMSEGMMGYTMRGANGYLDFTECMKSK